VLFNPIQNVTRTLVFKSQLSGEGIHFKPVKPKQVRAFL